MLKLNLKNEVENLYFDENVNKQIQHKTNVNDLLAKYSQYSITFKKKDKLNKTSK